MHKKTQIMQGKGYKNGKIGEVYERLCLDLKQVACFKYNFVLILFHYAATNHKLDGIGSSNVTHFFKLCWHAASHFWVFSPSSQFFSSPSKTEVTRENDEHDRS